MTLPAITRPNGKPYRPKFLAAYGVTDYADFDALAGVVVFGTHDPEIARPLAEAELCSQVYQGTKALAPELVWWRDAMKSGDRRWLNDDRRGRAGVFFAGYQEPDGSVWPPALADRMKAQTELTRSTQ